MNITFEPVTTIINRSHSALKALSAGAMATNNFSNRHEPPIEIADSVGFHLYGDLHLHLSLGAATEPRKADQYLEILQEYADIAAAVVATSRGLFIFEVQGERIHLFLDRPDRTDETISELIDFCTYFTRSVYRKIAPKAGDDFGGFCMATDFGRAIILNSGRQGDASLISLGNPANQPAKRLSRSPQVKAGHLAIKTRDGWEEINLRDRPLSSEKENRSRTIEESLARMAMNPAANHVLFSKAADIVDTTSATIGSPRMVQGYAMRIDLDGFTKRVEHAFAENSREQISNLVKEFLQILKIPAAFEEAVDRPLIRLPWAGDCYNAIFLLKPYEIYEDMTKSLAATLPQVWFDKEGRLHRDPSLAAVADRQKWSIGVAGGQESQGRMLVANITTPHRQFLVSGGWAMRGSLDAQNASGLRADETAIHVEDYRGLNDHYKGAFQSWEGGPTQYRKATSAALAKASKERTAAAPFITQVAPRLPALATVPLRPYGEIWD